MTLLETSSKEIKPLIGKVTTAHIDKLAHSVKTGKTIDFDTAIVANLKRSRYGKERVVFCRTKYH